MRRLLSNTLLLVSLLYTSLGFCCTCIGKSKIKSEIINTDIILSGTILSKEIILIPEEGIDKRFWFQYIKYEVSVDSKYKGVINDRMFIFSNIDSASCGFKFEIGKRYIIYADFFEELASNQMVLWTNICTRTQIFRELEDKNIRKYKRLLNN